MRHVKMTNKEYTTLVWYLNNTLKQVENEEVKSILRNKIFGCKQTSR